jgi:dienelactone hydrolase
MELHAIPARQAARLNAEDLRFYSYEHQPMPELAELELRRERGPYRVWNLDLPSYGDNGQPGDRVRARYIESRLPGRKRLIVVLPIYGKSFYPSHKVARYLTKERDAETTNVLLLLGHESLYDWKALAAAQDEEEFLDEIDRTVGRIQSTVIDIRRLLDWAAERPEIDRHRIGIVGFSFSSILANLTMAVDQRIAAGVFFMGGGHIHKIFAYCEGNDLEKARGELGRRLGWSDLHFERTLEKPLRPINPIRLASLLEARPVLLADSNVDAVIPPESRLALRRALGEPERIHFILGHRTAFLSLTPLGFDYSTRKIRRFFLENL